MSFISASNNVEIKTSDEMNNSLNELFNVVFDKSPCRQKPLNERQLPISFFVPPSGNNNVPPVSHYKAFSSPATLEETYRAGSGHQIINHFKQRSLDSQNGNQHYTDLSNILNVDVKSHSPGVETKPRLEIEIKELPSSYEMAINENYQVYFLNHNTKETTWFDPRLPETIQKWGMTLNELQDLHIRYMNVMSARHSSAQNHTLNLLRSPQANQTHSGSSDQTHLFNDPKSQTTHFRSCSQPVSSSGTSLGNVLVDSTSPKLNTFQMRKPVGNLQYFVNTGVNGGGSMLNNYQEFCRLHPDCSSSVQGSLSHSNNSSCSNLSTCLNGLNLSPLPSQNSRNSILFNHSPYIGHISPSLNVVAYSHSHQDSLDSGVGQSVVSQSQISSNVLSQNCDQAKTFDFPIKYEEVDNFVNCCNDKIDEFMDIDIRQINF